MSISLANSDLKDAQLIDINGLNTFWAKAKKVLFENSPIGPGDVENSAVLKGGNNQVISEGSVALGKDNISGLKGWYYKAVQIGNDSNVVYLYLTTEQQIPILVSTANAVENQEKDININISKGDICSIINGNRLIDCFEFRLNEISNYGRISFTYKGEGTNPLITIQNVEELKLEDYSVFCISKPSCGIVDLSKCNIALGNNTKSLAESSVSIGLRSTAVGITSYAEGQDTIAVGECSHAEGAFTKSNGIASHTEGFGTQTEGLSAHAEGYNTLASGGASHSEGSATKAIGLHSHAEGDTTEASGEQSHAEGKQTIAEGEHSHSEGYWTKAHGKSSHVEGQGLNNTTYSVASGDYSHSEGFYTRAFGTGSHTEGTYTIAYNKGEHAEGIYNKSTENVTLHSVGIGTSVNDRKNAHEITNDGKHYIIGVGGYDGTNPDSSDDLATVLSNRNDANGGGMTNVTYSELVGLRDSSTLKPGMFYRITDYMTTTTQSDTQSAEHQFDIIVIADDESTLNEIARACLHDGDTYFADSDLNAWQIWYSLDNDAERFAWADVENGKGVIYRMIDEWNNDCPYDFKNIIYVFNKSFMYNQWGNDYQFMRDTSLDKVIEGIQYYGYLSETTPSAWSEGKCWVTDAEVTANSQLYNEDGSQISYGGTIYNISNDEYESFTFNEGVLNDFSLEGESCYDNTILVSEVGLNRIVFKNDKTYEYQGQLVHNCHSNTFATNCHDNSFGNNCYNNNFENNCYNNSFGNVCCTNSFGNNCYNNNFENNCYNNSFGNECYNNNFENNCYNNSFGNYCYINSFGNECHANSFGNYCYINSFGNECHANSFGNYCYINSFGNDCHYNSFGNECHANSFGNDCYDNSFGNECYDNSFGNECYDNSFGNGCNINSFRTTANEDGDLLDYCQNNHFDDGCSYNVIWLSGTTSNSMPLKNININRGVCGTNSSYNYINIDTLNADYEIEVYKDEGGNICVDTFPVPLTTNDIDLLWSKYFNSGGYGSSSASATALDDVINSIGVGDYDETEQ